MWGKWIMGKPLGMNDVGGEKITCRKGDIIWMRYQP